MKNHKRNFIDKQDDKKDWLSQLLAKTITNPLENFRAAQKGDVPWHTPYLLLVAEFFLLPVTIIISSAIALKVALTPLLKTVLEIFK